MVGTHCDSVTRWRSISASAWVGAKLSITTEVAPRRCIIIVKRSGAAWYSGAGER